LSLLSARAGYCCSIAALVVLFGCESLQNATADGETRSISFHHIHTKENLTVTFKRRGRYDEQALGQINHLMRDWREDEPIKMDPHLIDLLWEVHREVGAKEPIWIVCGYRSSATNSKLRRRSSGVAKFSLHMQGKAIDFHIPGVALEEVQAAGLRGQRGGVGIYPSSGFVHMDTGSVRHWPRMPEAQLARVMAKGQLASRSASDDRRAVAVAHADSSGKPGFLSKLFGARRDEEDAGDRSQNGTKVAASPRSAAPASESKSERSAEKPARSADGVAAVPMPLSRPVRSESFHAPSAVAKAGARPDAAAPTTPAAPTAPGGFEMAAVSSKPVQLAQAAGPAGSARGDATANDIINARGYWQGLPGSEPSPNAARATPAAPARRAVALASAAPAAAASATPWPLTEHGQDEQPPSALAYAAQPTPIAAARALPMGVPRAGPPTDTTIAVKRSGDRPSVLPPTDKVIARVQPGDRFDDPWLRAMIVSPSAQGFMRTTLFGATDLRNLGPYLHKPLSAVLMTFGEDPHLGMTCEKFAGSAVGFVSTVTFRAARTAALH
jgi:uncharacterized protein YcbK (DUF882 family)